MIKIQVLRTAEIACADSILFRGDDRGGTTVIGCNAFLIDDGTSYSLVDTGIRDIVVANTTKSSRADWHRAGSQYDLSEALVRVGVTCNQIARVFLTHSHYDHISGVSLFEHAVFYLTQKEWELLYAEDNRLQGCLREAKDFLRTHAVVRFADSLDVGRFHLTRCGGHTAGSMMIDWDGKALFTGDAVFTHENLRRACPAGFVHNEAEAEAAMRQIMQFPGAVLTAHDRTEADLCLI